MNRINTCAKRGVAVGLLMLVASTLLAWSDRAEAACPDGEPCETIQVYRLQSRLPIQHDAAGRPILSLQEANATDAVSFRSILATATESTAYAIRYDVTRIADAPNNYCECNLEHDDRGCPSSLPRDQLQQCARVCRYNDGECQATGWNQKHDGGIWYAFPAATECDAQRDTWKKRTFGRTNPRWCDWTENARVIKSASCVAGYLRDHREATLDTVFNDDELCMAD